VCRLRAHMRRERSFPLITGSSIHAGFTEHWHRHQHHHHD
jgi:hypothetical protein